MFIFDNGGAGGRTGEYASLESYTKSSYVFATETLHAMDETMVGTLDLFLLYNPSTSIKA